MVVAVGGEGLCVYLNGVGVGFLLTVGEFQELPQSDRARLLSQLAARVLSHAVGI